jgi:hypothetical protein
LSGSSKKKREKREKREKSENAKKGKKEKEGIEGEGKELRVRIYGLAKSPYQILIQKCA